MKSSALSIPGLTDAVSAPNIKKHATDAAEGLFLASSIDGTLDQRVENNSALQDFERQWQFAKQTGKEIEFLFPEKAKSILESADKNELKKKVNFYMDSMSPKERYNTYLNLRSMEIDQTKYGSILKNSARRVEDLRRMFNGRQELLERKSISIANGDKQAFINMLSVKDKSRDITANILKHVAEEKHKKTEQAKMVELDDDKIRSAVEQISSEKLLTVAEKESVMFNIKEIYERAKKVNPDLAQNIAAAVTDKKVIGSAAQRSLSDKEMPRMSKKWAEMLRLS
ncbi:MAG: hypothetical protein QW445_07590 [Candidatus Bathyarchaeia archaeon]